MKFTRKLLKQSIIYKVYNVTTYGTADQLKSNLKSKNTIFNNNQKEDKVILDIQSNLKRKVE